MTIKRIISGGQTGADQGALFAARDLGLLTGGFAPRGWRTEAGPAPWLAEYGLIEAPSGNYPQRTKLNVLNSQATLVFGDITSRGNALTKHYAALACKPFFHISWKPTEIVPYDEYFKMFIRGIETLNVAGNRESRAPGITDAVREFLNLALRRQL